MTALDPPPSTEPPQSAKAKVFRDPVHDLIYFTPEDRWLVDVVDTKEFQRLRRIHQLGLANLVYPGAEHSRFAHSLGVFDVSRRMIRKLKHRHDQDGTIRDELDSKSKTIKAAALLHDLGHGPFSHVFERVFRELATPPPKHAEWSCRLLREKTEIGDCLRQNEVPIDEICSLISEEEGPPDPLYLRDIVSSQLDADRIDYLLRDSLMTGSRYGQFDSEWILNALLIAEPRIGDLTVKKLCLDASKGTGAIEGFLFARLQMLKYVYGHKTTRAYEAELVQALRLALRLHHVLPNETPPPVRMLLQKGGNITAKEFLALDDEVMWWALRTWASWKEIPPSSDGALARALKDHSLRLVRRQRPWDFTEVAEGEPQIAAVQLYDRLVKNDDPLQYECFVDTLEDLPYKDFRYLVEARKGKAPSDEADEASSFGEIYLVGRDEKAVRLSKYDKSPILTGLAQEFKLYRFYFNRVFHKDFTGQLQEFGVC